MKYSDISLKVLQTVLSFICTQDVHNYCCLCKPFFNIISQHLFSGHRFRPIHDFGYVALDIVDLIAEDSGTYTCRAVNLLGTDEVICTLKCQSKLGQVYV